MLKKGLEDGVVVDYTNIYNKFFVANGEGNTKITAARLPFFDGDYWSGAAESILKKFEVEERSIGGLQSKLPNKRILKSMGQDKPDVAVKDVLVMQKVTNSSNLLIFLLNPFFTLNLYSSSSSSFTVRPNHSTCERKLYDRPFTKYLHQLP